MLITVVNEIIESGTLEQIKEAIEPLAPVQRSEALRAASELLLEQARSQVAQENIHHSVWLMSKISLIVDMAMNEQRKAHHVIQADHLKMVATV